MNQVELKDKILKTFEHNLYQYGSDNPILFTVEFYLVCKKIGILTKSDIISLEFAIRSLQRIHKGKKIDGLYNRHPYQNDRTEDHDNYVGLASASIFGLIWPAKGIDDYGMDNFYSYDNVTMGFKWSELRQPFDIMLYRIAAQRPLGFLGMLGYVHMFFKILLYTFKDKQSTSSRMLDWLRVETYDRWYLMPLKKLYYFILNKQYRRGIVDVFEIYHRGSDLYKLAEYM